MRAFSIVRNILAVVGLVALGWFAYDYAVSHILVFPWVWEEKRRITSPSGMTDIVVFQGNRGAMSSYRYAYFLAPHGGTVDASAHDGYDAFLVCSSPAPIPAWKSDRHLVIPYEGGRIFFYQPLPKGFEIAADMDASSGRSQK